MVGWLRWALVSPDEVAPSRMVSVSVSVNLPLHHKVQKFSSDTGSPGGLGKRAVKWLWWWCFWKRIYDDTWRRLFMAQMSFLLPNE